MNRNRPASGSESKRRNAEDTTGSPPRGAAAPVALVWQQSFKTRFPGWI
jgi:hypothetical protein